MSEKGGGIVIRPFYGEGALKKLGGMGGRTPQTRWFELRGQQLVYYSEQPRGMVDLSGEVQVQEEADGESWTLTGQHLAHPYTLTANTAAERAQWLQMIRQSIRGPQEGYLDGRFANLEVEREALIATTEQLGKEITQKTGKVQQLTENLAQTTTSLAETSANLLSSRQRVTQLESEVVTLRETYQAQRHTAETTHSSEVGAMRAEVESLSKESRASKETVAELRASLQGSIGTVRKLTRELEEANQRYLRMAKEMQAQKDDFSAKILAQSAEALHERQALQKSADEKVESLSAKVERLTEGLAESSSREKASDVGLAAATAALSRTQGEIDRYREKLTDLTATTSRLQGNLAACQNREAALAVLASPSVSPGDAASAASAASAPGVLHNVVGVQGTIVRVGEDTQSAFICRLPTGACVTVAEMSGRRARIVEPFAGWISVETSAGISIVAPAADYTEGAQGDDHTSLTPGDCAKLTVVKYGKIAGRATVIVDEISRPDGKYRVSVRRSALSHALGLGDHAVVEPHLLTKASPSWVIYDHPDASRTCSTSGFDHPSGFGSNAGRLSSTAAWFSKEGDTTPWYQIDLGRVQPVAGVALGGYIGSGAKAGFVSHVTQFRVEHCTEAGGEWVPIPETYHADDANVDVYSFSPEPTDALSSLADDASLHSFTQASPVMARFIRVHPTQWTGITACMKVGLVVSQWFYPEDAYSSNVIFSSPETNGWLKDGFRDAQLLGIEDKVKALHSLNATIEARADELERERGEFAGAQRLLLDANMLLTENIRSLQDKGEFRAKRTVLCPAEELLGVVFDGTLITEAPEPSEARPTGALEAGMRVAEVGGIPVQSEEEVRAAVVEWERVQRDAEELVEGVPVSVTQVRVSPYAVCVREELEAMRNEIRRQHSVIHSLEQEREEHRARSHSEKVALTQHPSSEAHPRRPSPVNEVVL